MARAVRAACLLAVVLAVLLGGGPAPAAAFYGRGSNVLTLKTAKDVTALKNSKFLWVVELYREGCGYCQQLTPEYEKLAGKLRKMVRIAAVDVEKQSSVAQQLMREYDFQVKGVPTIILLKPEKGGTKKRRIDYQGQRKAADMKRFALGQMPDYVRLVTTASFEAFQIRSSLPKAILFTDKKVTPPLFKALSTKYLDRMEFGIVDRSNKALPEKFGVTETPAIYVLKEGNATPGSEEAGPLKYEGKVSFLAIDVFLVEHAAPKPAKKGAKKADSKKRSPAPKKTADKGKDNKADSKKPKSKPAPKEASKAKSEKKKGAFKTQIPASMKPTAKQKRLRKELGKQDLNKMKIKELRAALKDGWGETCTDCVEKFHFVDRIQSLIGPPSCEVERSRLDDRIGALEKENEELREELAKLRRRREEL